jgi:hypothetical protein
MNPLLGPRELRGGKGCWIRHRRHRGARVAGSLLVSEWSGASEACSGAAEKLSDLQNALLNYPVYLSPQRPQAKSCLPTVHVKEPRGDDHFCLEALYLCDFVGPGDGSETTVFNPLEIVI